PYEPTTSPSTTIAPRTGAVPNERFPPAVAGASASGSRRGRRGCRCGLRRALYQAGDGIGHLRATLLPESDAIDRETQRFLVLGRNGIVEADALDEAPVAPIARVGDDDVEEGALLCAATSQSDDDHVVRFRKTGFR